MSYIEPTNIDIVKDEFTLILCKYLLAANNEENFDVRYGCIKYCKDFLSQIAIILDIIYKKNNAQELIDKIHHSELFYVYAIDTKDKLYIDVIIGLKLGGKKYFHKKYIEPEIKYTHELIVGYYIDVELLKFVKKVEQKYSPPLLESATKFRELSDAIINMLKKVYVP